MKYLKYLVLFFVIVIIGSLFFVKSYLVDIIENKISTILNQNVIVSQSNISISNVDILIDIANSTHCKLTGTHSFFDYNIVFDCYGNIKDFGNIIQLDYDNEFVTKGNINKIKENIYGSMNINTKNETINITNIVHNLSQNITTAKYEVLLSNLEELATKLGYKARGAISLNGEVTISNEYQISINTQSLGGTQSAYIDNSNIKLSMQNLELEKLIYILSTPAFVENAKINGEVTLYGSNLMHNFGAREINGMIDITSEDMQFNGFDIDNIISTSKDATSLLQLSACIFLPPFASSMTQEYPSAILSHLSYDKHSYITHMQTSVNIKNGIAKLKDVGFETPYNTIVLSGNIDLADMQNLSFDISQVDKNGCMIATQSIQGNLQVPTITTTKNVDTKESCTPIYKGALLKP